MKKEFFQLLYASYLVLGFLCNSAYAVVATYTTWFGNGLLLYLVSIRPHLKMSQLTDGFNNNLTAFCVIMNPFAVEQTLDSPLRQFTWLYPFHSALLYTTDYDEHDNFIISHSCLTYSRHSRLIHCPWVQMKPIVNSCYLSGAIIEKKDIAPEDIIGALLQKWRWNAQILIRDVPI